MQLLDIHTHSKALDTDTLRVVNSFPQDELPKVFFSVGWHPWYLNAAQIEEQMALVAKRASYANCLAIGECGLDKVTDTDFDLQISVFKKHVVISESLEKPLIIHCVKSFQEIYRLKKELQPSQSWILHGFTKNEQVANQLITQGFLLSFGAALFKNSSVQRTFANLLPEIFFLETDDQDIFSIEHIYEKAAELRGISVEELQHILTKNFKKVFKV